MTESLKFLKEIAAELNSVPTKEEKLETIIYYGKSLDSKMEGENFEEKDKVPGCISLTYLKALKSADQTLTLIGTSDSIIVKGYLYFFTQAYSGLHKDEILQNIDSETDAFIKEAKIDTDLTPSRTNTFLNIIIQIKKLAAES